MMVVDSKLHSSGSVNSNLYTRVMLKLYPIRKMINDCYQCHRNYLSNSVADPGSTPSRPPRLRLFRLRCAYNAMLRMPILALSSNPPWGMSNERVLPILSDDGLLHNKHTDCSLGSSRQHQFSILPDDALPTTANLSWREEYARGDCKANIHAAAHLSVNKEHYRIEARLEAFANGNRVSADQWDGETPCDPGG